jgi:hypothetical protein
MRHRWRLLAVGAGLVACGNEASLGSGIRTTDGGDATAGGDATKRGDAAFACVAPADASNPGVAFSGTKFDPARGCLVGSSVALPICGCFHGTGKDSSTWCFSAPDGTTYFATSDDQCDIAVPSGWYATQTFGPSPGITPSGVQAAACAALSGASTAQGTYDMRGPPTCSLDAGGACIPVPGTCDLGSPSMSSYDVTRGCLGAAVTLPGVCTTSVDRCTPSGGLGTDCAFAPDGGVFVAGMTDNEILTASGWRFVEPTAAFPDPSVVPASETATSAQNATCALARCAPFCPGVAGVQQTYGCPDAGPGDAGPEAGTVFGPCGDAGACPGGSSCYYPPTGCTAKGECIVTGTMTCGSQEGLCSCNGALNYHPDCTPGLPDGYGSQPSTPAPPTTGWCPSTLADCATPLAASPCSPACGSGELCVTPAPVCTGGTCLPAGPAACQPMPSACDAGNGCECLAVPSCPTSTENQYGTVFSVPGGGYAVTCQLSP